jgi:hypothetical protein
MFTIKQITVIKLKQIVILATVILTYKLLKEEMNLGVYYFFYFLILGIVYLNLK